MTHRTALLSLLAVAAALGTTGSAQAADVALVGTGCTLELANDRGLVRGGPIAVARGDEPAGETTLDCVVQWGATYGDGDPLGVWSGDTVGGIAVVKAAVLTGVADMSVCSVVRWEDGETVLDADADEPGAQCAKGTELSARPRFWYSDAIDLNDSGVKARAVFTSFGGAVSLAVVVSGLREPVAVYDPCSWVDAPPCPMPEPSGGGDPPCPIGPLTSEALTPAWNVGSQALSEARKIVSVGGAALCPAAVFRDAGSVRAGETMFVVEPGAGQGFEVKDLNGHQLAVGAAFELELDF